MTLRHLAAALLLAACAVPAAAQDLRPIRAADTVGVGAPNLVRLVERLRPEWVRAGGDPTEPTSWPRVRVFRGGVFAGGLDALHGMPVEGLTRIQLAGPRAALARDPRTPKDATAAILVTYATDRRARRVEFVLGAGRRSTGVQERAASSLVEAGWDPAVRTSNAWTAPERQPGTVFAAATVNMHRRAGVTLSAHRTGEFNVRGIADQDPPLPPLGHTTWFGTTDVAATVSVRSPWVRAGVGPALRVVDYRRTTGYCECREVESGATAAAGVAADLGIVFPPYGPAVMHLQASARWFPSHGVPAGAGMPRIEVGGIATYVAVGAGFGL